MKKREDEGAEEEGTSCCGDYHYADCPIITDRYAGPPEPFLDDWEDDPRAYE